MRVFKWFGQCIGLVVAMVGTAHAIDVVQNAPPQVISDNKLTIGARTLILPGGNWNFVAQYQGNLTYMDRDAGKTRRVYALDSTDGVFKAGVELWLPEASAAVKKWTDDPCKVEGQLFKDDLSSGFATPECLVIYKRANHLTSSTTGNFYPQASQWLASQKVNPPGPVYEISYAKYATGDFGRFKVWVPANSVTGDDAIIAWAKGLPERLRRFSEKRDLEISLPALPTRP